MIRLLAGLVPAVGAPVAGMKLLRPRAVQLLAVVAALDAALALAVAFGTPAGSVVRVVDGFFVVDATSRLFLLVVNFVFLGVAAYVWTRVRDTPELQERIERLVTFSLGFIAAANLAILSNHLVAMWVLVELTTLAAVPLVQHRGTAARLRASWKYFLFSSVGLALTLLGFACLARGMEASGAREATFFLDGLAEAARQPTDVWRRLGLVLVLLGLGTKLGLAPMYVWLPDTYQQSPPAVTVLLAAVQFNVALVAVFRVVQIYHRTDQDVISAELVTLGLATMAVSAFGIIATRNYIRLIALASLNHGGVIAIGLGIGGVAAYGVVLYAVSNAFIKAILFLTAGKIEAHYRTEDVREVSGLLKDMPYSGLFFMVGTFALLGFPPFGSFLGELIVMSGLIGRGYYGVFAAFCTILTATFIATGRSVFPMIWGEPRKRVDWASQPLATILPKLVFLACLLAMGLYLPAPVNALFRQVAAGLGAQ
ncbi:proton-conducting transporter transmembrane domain-containing protein [Anaeromyxobacter oryzae]|uniref:Hydrogenase 4 subunit F n=1 Tax=Anaeromyxobacter oryzae TaxID=2918170 RepID=A0ABN6MNJ7_9BACT|nr:proton-conducting transporter membrane subunit [Anaeromyxobacter oryzae]BDG02561.1 hydrogenase 4 subunit F [Anaeromyxobacter oryzae]